MNHTRARSERGRSGRRWRRRLAPAIGTLFLTLAAAWAQAQARKPAPPPELKKLDVWIGNWMLSGTARDQPGGPEYSLRWRLREHWTFSGFGSDGSTWSLTATFHDATMVETGNTLGPHGTLTRCVMTWVFGNHGRSLAGTEECDKGGTRWKAVDVTGAKTALTQ